MTDPMIEAMIELINQNFSNATGHPKHDLKSSTNAGEKDLERIKIDKLFEVVALSELLAHLRSTNRNCKFQLMHQGKPGTKLVLQSSPGKADPQKSYIRMELNGKDLATIWTNVEFVGISGNPSHKISTGSYHEADILMVKSSAHPQNVQAIRPKHTDVLLVIECKFLDIMPKGVLRNMLGLRREMSWRHRTKTSLLLNMLDTRSTNKFSVVPADPATHLILCYPNHYRFSPNVDWKDPANMFGIEFWPF